MGNVAMHSAIGRARLAHYLVQARGNFAGEGRPYWECSCYAGRFLPAKPGEAEADGEARARASHERHAAKAIAAQRRLGLS